jgi:hypothetical protein
VIGPAKWLGNSSIAITFVGLAVVGSGAAFIFVPIIPQLIHATNMWQTEEMRKEGLSEKEIKEELKK